MNELTKKIAIAYKNKDFITANKYKLELKVLRETMEEEAWKNLKTFKDIYDIPKLPIPLTDFQINKLIECGAIPKKDLIIGQKYIGRYRVTDTATWGGTVFVYEKDNFGAIHLETCYHFEDDDGFALFVPLKKI